MGANTANAVMGYQRAKGLTVDGIVGDETWNSIYKDKKKSESFFGEERKSSRRTTDDNGIPNMPEMDTYKPKSERKDNHFSSNFDVWSGIGNPLKDYGKSDDESLHDKVRRRWGNGGNPSRVLSLSRDNTPGISTSPFRTYKPTGIAFDDYAFSEDESDFSRGNRRTDIPESEYLPEDEIFATEEPELTLMSNPESKDSGESNAEETNWLWDYIRNPKETVIRFAKEAGKTIDEAQKELQRNVWQLGADNYLRKNKYYVSAYMLEHSLQDNPTSMTLGNESDIAELIKKDPVYLTALDEAIANSDGKTIDVPLKNIQFDTDDLYYSIHRATIRVKGYKNSEGKWIITAKLEDTYDFTEWMTVKFENGKLSFDIRTGTVANDVAKISQSTGAINPYMVRVYFNTIR